MAIVNVKKGWSGQRSSAHTDGSTGGRDADDVYTILVDDPTNDTTLTVEASPLVVQIGDQHPGDPFRRCTNVHTERVSPTLFKLTPRYGMVGLDVNGVPAPGLSPLDVRPLIRWTANTTDGPIDESVTGTIIGTVNGEPFDPPVTEELSDLVLVYTRNMAVYDSVFFAGFSNRVNSAPFLNWPAGTVLCKAVVAENVLEKGFEYWRVTGEFHFREQGKATTAEKTWYKRIAHEGFMVRASAGAEPKWAEDGEGNKVPVPVRLNADGTKKSDQSTANWLEFKTRYTADLNSMNLIL